MPIVPSASNTPFAGEQREPHAQQREHQPDQRAEVLQQHHRQLGVVDWRMNCHHDTGP
jgi:hypothetical protein